MEILEVFVLASAGLVVGVSLAIGTQLRKYVLCGAAAVSTALPFVLEGIAESSTVAFFLAFAGGAAATQARGIRQSQSKAVYENS